MPSEPLRAPEQLQQELRRVSNSYHSPDDPVIFRQGEFARGVYLVESGSIRMSFRGDENQILYERVLGQGSLLGLPATINAAPYSATAIANQNCELRFVSRDDLLGLMTRNGTVAMTILQLLSQEIHDMREVIVGSKGRPKQR